MAIVGTGSNLRHIPIHEIVQEMDHRVSFALPMFHALTGCDTVSSFCGRGKKTAWNTWKVFPEATQAFEELQQVNTNISESAMATVERFVVLLYDRTSNILNVNDSRKHLFIQKARSLENLPPTQEALKQHTRRAIYQEYCWNRALLAQQELPNPADWGWKKGELHELGTTVDHPFRGITSMLRAYTLWVQERVYSMV